MSLAGRVALITGSSQGLGAAIASQFLAQGAAVSLCARSHDDLVAQHAQLSTHYPPDRMHIQTADVAAKAEVEALFDATLAAFGRLDILVNNAGVYGPMGAIDALDWEQWVDALHINLVGTAYCARQAIAIFKVRRYGKIINVSGGGATQPLPGLSAYAASKAAVVRLTETLALEVKDWGIDVNALAPGALATRLTDQLVDAGPERVGAALHAQMVKVKADGGTPLRHGAELCAYLASAQSDGLTGRLIAARWDPWPFDDAISHELAASDIYTLRRVEAKDRQKSWGERRCGSR
jgi:NAD(P)-dependent dehydrogenase (short-subunit alcohol dehydrogenase family)